MAETNLRDTAYSLARSAVALVADAACDETTKLRAAIEQKDQIIAGLLEAIEPLESTLGTMPADKIDGVGYVLTVDLRTLSL